MKKIVSIILSFLVLFCVLIYTITNVLAASKNSNTEKALQATKTNYIDQNKTDIKYNYNRTAARQCMKKHWDEDRSLNHNYYHYNTGNCANFVSQCVFEGGIPMNDTWYSKKLDSAQKDENSKSTKFKVGEPWRLANNQFLYFSDKNNGYINGEVIKINSNDKIDDIIKKCKEEGNPIQVGDLMYQSQQGRQAHHATIISHIDDDMIKYAANTKKHFDCDATSLFEDNQWIEIIRLKNSNS